MKRAPNSGELCGEFPAASDEKSKRAKLSDEEQLEETMLVNLDENLLFEVLKHVDARTLATAACICKQWRETAHDERLWEMICMGQWDNIGCGSEQLRSVVLALGGFRRLHSLCLWPLFKSSSHRSMTSSLGSLSSTSFSPSAVKKTHHRWGKDEVHLSLSLLSIRYYVKMKFSNKR